jgi:hypothetical protein
MPIFKKKKIEPVGQGLLPCLTGAQILTEKTIAPLVIELKNLVSVPTALYDTLYLTSLKRIAEFCQAMPWCEKSQPYTLLIEQMRLCCAVLKQRQGLMLPQGSSAERIAEQEPLWTFAFFTAALLFCLSEIQYDRAITLFNANGSDKTAWHPVWGTLYQDKKFYAVTWQPYYVLPNNSLHGALINHLLPQTALHWLAGSANVFSVWWQAVCDGEDKNNIITQVITDVAQKINYVPHIQGKHYQQTKTVVKQSITTVEVDNSQLTSPNEILQQLMEWLQQIILEETVPVEKEVITTLPTVFKTESGLFVANQVLDKFIDENQDWENHLELVESIKSCLIEENENRFFRFRSVEFDDRRFVEGVVIANEYLADSFKKLPKNNQLISFETYGGGI